MDFLWGFSLYLYFLCFDWFGERLLLSLLILYTLSLGIVYVLDVFLSFLGVMVSLIISWLIESWFLAMVLLENLMLLEWDQVECLEFCC